MFSRPMPGPRGGQGPVGDPGFPGQFGRPGSVGDKGETGPGIKNFLIYNDFYLKLEFLINY